MRYARIQDGATVEIIEPFYRDDGTLVPMQERFHPDVLATMVPLPDEEVPPQKTIPPKVSP